MNELDKFFGELFLWLLIVFGPAFAIVFFVILCQSGFGGFAIVLILVLINSWLNER
jgi:hypothetical protein